MRFTQKPSLLLRKMKIRKRRSQRFSKISLGFCFAALRNFLFCLKWKKIEKVLSELRGVPKEKRTARFLCSIALASPHQLLFVVEGHCEGFITEKPRGNGGFGYDPIFYVPDYNH